MIGFVIGVVIGYFAKPYVDKYAVAPVKALFAKK